MAKATSRFCTSYLALCYAMPQKVSLRSIPAQAVLLNLDYYSSASMLSRLDDLKSRDPSPSIWNELCFRLILPWLAARNNGVSWTPAALTMT